MNHRRAHCPHLLLLASACSTLLAVLTDGLVLPQSHPVQPQTSIRVLGRTSWSQPHSLSIRHRRSNSRSLSSAVLFGETPAQTSQRMETEKLTPNGDSTLPVDLPTNGDFDVGVNGDANETDDEVASSMADTKVNGDSEAAPISIANGGPDSITESEGNAKKPPFPVVLWRFTRPHTLIGSALAIPSLHLFAAPTYGAFFTKQALTAMGYAAVPSLLMNLYITGLNQITDVEIDKINKPDLPIAKGDLKKSTAIAVVLVALVVSLVMGAAHPIYGTGGLNVALWGSFLLGTMYSLPPFRLKRHPLLALFCIVAVRGTIVNSGFYSHALTAAFGGGAAASAGTGVLDCLMHDPRCAISSLFFGIFGIVIALMKDVPDVAGDRIFNIRSFTVRVGQSRVFGSMKRLLMGLFGAFGAGFLRWAAISGSTVEVVRRAAVGVACWVAFWSTGREAREVDPEDSGGVYKYYMHLWKLFYLSYLVLPFAK